MVEYGSGYKTYASDAATAAASAGIPESILSSVIQQESSWNPAVPVGAANDTGLGQVTPGVYNDSRYNNGGKLSPFVPSQNIQIAANYLGALYKRAGNWNDALSEYNTGKPASATTTGANYAKSVLGRVGGGDDVSVTGSNPDSVAKSVMNKLSDVINYQILSKDQIGPGASSPLLSAVLSLTPMQIAIVIGGGALILFAIYQLVKDPINSVAGATSKIALAAA